MEPRNSWSSGAATKGQKTKQTEPRNTRIDLEQPLAATKVRARTTEYTGQHGKGIRTEEKLTTKSTKNTKKQKH